MSLWVLVVYGCLTLASQPFIAVLGQSTEAPKQMNSLPSIDLANDPAKVIKELLERSIQAGHRRPRKAVSSQSVMNFKSNKPKLKRKYGYPSTWGKFVLFCRTGWLLQVLPNGDVNGTNDINSAYAVLQIQILSPTVVRIKGIESGRYIAINSRGRLVSKRYPTRETVFEEEVLENYYHTLKSNHYPTTKSKGWYIGIRKNGSRKRASKTKLGERCIQFLKVPLADL